MKSYTFKSRYGVTYRADLINKDTIHLYFDGSLYVRGGYKDDSTKFTYIDPDGGPFIALYETASYCIHPELPKREIIEINFDDDKKCYVVKLDSKKKKKELKDNK